MWRERRCTQIKTYSWDNAQVVLVGNKCDLEYERVVSAERGRRLADQLGNVTPPRLLRLIPLSIINDDDASAILNVIMSGLKPPSSVIRGTKL